MCWVLAYLGPGLAAAVSLQLTRAALSLPWDVTFVRHQWLLLLQTCLRAACSLLWFTAPCPCQNCCSCCVLRPDHCLSGMAAAVLVTTCAWGGHKHAHAWDRMSSTCARCVHVRMHETHDAFLHAAAALL